jgi:hypothetical protein
MERRMGAANSGLQFFVLREVCFEILINEVCSMRLIDKCRATQCFLTAIGLSFFSAGAVFAADNPTVNSPKPDVPRACLAVRTEVAPTIDGQLDDACWRDKTSYSGFVESTIGTTASADSNFRVIYDDRSLYLAIELTEPAIDQLVGKTRRFDDSDIWKDDCVEVFLQPSPAQSLYYHLTINPYSARRDGAGFDGNVDIPWSATSSIGQGRWTIEVEVPFTSLGLKAPQSGTVMRLNVCRERQAGKTEAKIAENSVWSRLTRGFHEQADFGYMVIDDYNTVLRRQFDDLKSQLGVMRQLTSPSLAPALQAIGEQLNSPGAIKTETEFRDGLRRIERAKTELNGYLAQEVAASDTRQSDLIISHRLPYDGIAADLLAQLTYYAAADAKKSTPVELNYKQAINEYEHDGFVISSRAKATGLRLSATDLKGPNGKSIPARNVTLNAVGYLNPGPDTDFNYPLWNKVPSPDLVEEIRHDLSLNSFENKQIWVTVSSFGVTPGEYKGKILIRDGQQKTLREIPVSVTVWPVALPKRSPLDVYLFAGVPWGGKSGQMWADFQAKHYASYVYMELPGDFTIDGKHIEHEGTGIQDQSLGYDVSGKKIEIAGKKWGHQERLKIIREHGLKVNLDSGRGLLQKEILPAYVDYMRRSGFGYADFRYKLSDEDLSPWSLPLFKTYHEVDPRLRLVMCPAGSWDITPYSPYIQTYMCSYSVTAWQDWLKLFQAEKKRGKEFSIYTNWPSWTGRAPLEQIRQDLSFIWQIGATEYSAWNADIYPPTGYTYGYASSAAPLRNVTQWPPERQSTSTLIYVRREGDLYYPVSCKRLEAIRDGVKDWMYLRLLSDLIERAPKQMQAHYRNVLNKLALDSPRTQTEFHARKIQAVRSIMELQKLQRSA